MARVTTPNLIPQNKFSTSLLTACTSTDTTIYLNSLPTATEGFLTIEEGTSNEEVIFYNSKGSNFVTCPSVADGRGVYGAAIGHLGGVSVKQKVVAEYYKALQDLSALNAGTVVQDLETDFNAVATGSTVIPFDDTIPQITEGDEYMTITVTPKSSTSNLIIDANIHISHTASGEITAALFQDATANAIGAMSLFNGTATGRVNLRVRAKVATGATTATTFRIRAGSESAGTATFNGVGGGRRFGAITKSSIRVTEVKA